MKSILYSSKSLLLALFCSVVLIGAGVNPVAVGIVTVAAVALTKIPTGSLAVGLNVDQVKTELGSYLRSNNKEVRQIIYNEAQAARYMKKVGKVKGRYPAGHTVTGHLVQGFQSVWNKIGETKFVVNELFDYQQKVNYGFKPADILNSWYAELYQEGKKPADMPISKYILEKELKPRVVADVDYLLGNGVYDANDLATFGKSMNGIKKILADGVASSTKPMFKIPLDPLHANNMVDQVDKFEDEIPDKLDGLITKIYMSSKNKKRYMRDYRNLYGSDTDYTKGATLVTYSGEREIVGLRCLNGSDIIFATPDNNFIELIDEIDGAENPIVTDIQIADYEVKVFMEWWLGTQFWVNQLVLVSVTTGSGSGLTTDHELYFG
jgi:hypothetical protein